MSELITNLNNILDIKGNIKSAIENKGVDMTGVSFPGYASKIGEITTSFVTVPLNVSVNGTYNPGQGVDGYSQVVVDVPQSVTGFTEKEITEGIQITDINNNASYVNEYAFINNRYLQTVNLPNCTSVGSYAFQSCSSLTQVSLPVCSYIGSYAFGNCISLTSIDLPMCSRIDATFQSCSSLTQVSLPVCSYIGNFAFNSCTSLPQVSLPICSYIAYMTFGNCYSLSQVILPMCNTISDYAFRNCSSLSIITIGYSGVCNLKNSNAFSDTPIASGTGSIYVPTSLVESYKSATNWTYFSNKIFGI